MIQLRKGELYPSIQIKDAIPRPLIDSVVEAAKEFENEFIKYFLDKSLDDYRVYEIAFWFTGDDFHINSAIYYTHTGKTWKHRKDDDLEFAVLAKEYEENFSALKEVRLHLLDVLKKNDRPGNVTQLTYFNFDTGFPAHTDSLDVKNKYAPRPETWDIPKEQYWPNPNYDNVQQGLINLNAPATNGTVMFDQWYPWSVYYEYDIKLEDADTAKFSSLYKGKKYIYFFKDEEPYRFGEKIRNFTGNEFPEQDYKDILQHCDGEEIRRNQVDGLSLEKMLFFDTPGTVTSWDTRRFHMPIPFKRKMNDNRMTLQYFAEELCE